MNDVPPSTTAAMNNCSKINKGGNGRQTADIRGPKKEEHTEEHSDESSDGHTRTSGSNWSNMAFFVSEVDHTTSVAEPEGCPDRLSVCLRRPAPPESSGHPAIYHGWY
jgi:hypothetical protein